MLFKKENIAICAPVSGICIDITQVHDPAFSQKLMGDGFAVIPADELVGAPVDGKITMLFETKHAFGMKTKDGLEVMVHIGIDTCNLGGRGFTALKKQQDKVKAGEPIIQIDKDLLTQTEMDMTTMVIVVNNSNKAFQKSNLGMQVNRKTPVMEVLQHL